MDSNQPERSGQDNDGGNRSGSGSRSGESSPSAAGREGAPPDGGQGNRSQGNRGGQSDRGGNPRDRTPSRIRGPKPPRQKPAAEAPAAAGAPPAGNAAPAPESAPAAPAESARSHGYHRPQRGRRPQNNRSQNSGRPQGDNRQQSDVRPQSDGRAPDGGRSAGAENTPVGDNLPGSSAPVGNNRPQQGRRQGGSQPGSGRGGQNSNNRPRSGDPRQRRPEGAPRDGGSAPDGSAPQPEGSAQSWRDNRRRTAERVSQPVQQDPATGEPPVGAGDGLLPAGSPPAPNRRAGQQQNNSRRGNQPRRGSRPQSPADAAPKTGLAPGEEADLAPTVVGEIPPNFDSIREPRKNRPQGGSRQQQSGSRPQGAGRAQGQAGRAPNAPNRSQQRPQGQDNRRSGREPQHYTRPEDGTTYVSFSDRYNNNPNRPAPSVPIPTDRGIKLRSQRGGTSKNWWARRWIDAMERLVDPVRLQRGRNYARSGQVLSIQETYIGIEATVQGSRPAPYKVSIQLTPLTDSQWDLVVDALSEQALFTAQLLAGEMPGSIEDAFQSAGMSLFPTRGGDLFTSCSCPDWANPCKHVAASHYILGDRFDDDPFLLFRMRGRTQDEILEALRQRRGGQTKDEEDTLATATAAPGLEEVMPHYWESAEDLDSFPLTITPPTVDMPLLKRLGEPAFLPGESLPGLLKPVYDSFTRSALRAAYTEDETVESSPAEDNGS